MKPPPEDPLATLHIADPDVAASVAAGLNQKGIPVSFPDLSLMGAEIIWGLSLERSFGQALARGYVSLMGEVPEAIISQYRKAVRKAGGGADAWAYHGGTSAPGAQILGHTSSGPVH